MATSKNYVVGARPPPSGVFRRDVTGVWPQAGFNYPFTFASPTTGTPETLYLAAGIDSSRLTAAPDAC